MTILVELPGKAVQAEKPMAAVGTTVNPAPLAQTLLLECTLLQMENHIRLALWTSRAALYMHRKALTMEGL